jgi:hypothetical protein
MSLKSLESLVEDKTFTMVASLVLTLYAGLAAPALPNSVILFFDTFAGKLLFLFLIGFTASRNIQVALMVALAFIITLHTLNKRKTEEYLNYKAAMEHFANSERENFEDEEAVDEEGQEDFEDEGQEDYEDEDGQEDYEDEEEGEDEEGEDEEGEGEDEEGEDEEGEGEEGQEDYENFQNYSDEPVENFDNSSTDNNEFFDNVQPAHNLNGDSSEMFAPVKF